MDILNKSNYYARLINPYHLKNIYRYSDRLTNIKESVAEHSFFVSVILCELLEHSNASDKLIADSLIACLRHDMLESVITDIPHSTKQNDNVFNKAIEDAEERLQIKDKPKKHIECLVKIADILQVIQFLLHEKKLGNNNKDIINIEKQSNDRLKEKLLELNTYQIEFDYGLFLEQVRRLINNEFFI